MNEIGDMDMRLKVFAVVISLMFFGSFAHADVVNFECTYGSVGADRTSPISHSVDMTNKSWAIYFFRFRKQCIA